MPGISGQMLRKSLKEELGMGVAMGSRKALFSQSTKTFVLSCVASSPPQTDFS